MHLLNVTSLDMGCMRLERGEGGGGRIVFAGASTWSAMLQLCKLHDQSLSLALDITLHQEPLVPLQSQCCFRQC